MAETGWTKGPWTLETVRTSSGICHKIGPFPWKADKTNHACIYVDYPSHDGSAARDKELLANARLIAAATDMAEALVNVRKIIAEGAMEGFNPEVGTWAQRLFESQQCTSAALARARGQEQEKT